MVKKIIKIYFEVGILSLIVRIGNKIKENTNKTMVIINDCFFQTYSIKFPINYLIYNDTSDFKINSNRCIPKDVLLDYFEHKFDLLGSGWVEVKYGMACGGIQNYLFDKVSPPDIDSSGEWLNKRINYSNLRQSKSIWKLIDVDYKPIDWQIDFKSGYRWSEKVHSKRIDFGKVVGVDVKVPWELSRMQHLPQIAFSFLNGNLGDDDKIKAKKEFRNQILDFIATNPPRYGVNWVCAMDVAIRATNWIVGYKLFCSGGAKFDSKFRQLFFQSIHEHGEFVFLNLEWNNGKRGNHYLSDICGLVFISIFLPSNPKYNSWLNFAINELKSEVNFQFFNDGSNFEYSTAYHRLSMEMVIFATSFILGIPKDRVSQLGFHINESLDNADIIFSDEYFIKLSKISEFICNASKSGFILPQLGDNDSGRFLKLDPKFKIYSNKEVKLKFENLVQYNYFTKHKYYFEDHLECETLLSSAQALLGLKCKHHASLELDANSLNYSVIKALMEGNELSNRDICSNKYSYSYDYNDSVNIFNHYLNNIKLLNSDKKRTFSYPLSIHVGNIRIFSYPDFGLILFKSEGLYLSVRCYTYLHQFSPKGHIHEDQLSIELSIDNIDIIKDAGSFIYTALPIERNFYRSADSHFSPIPTINNKFLSNDVFEDIQIPLAEVIYLGDKGFIAEVFIGENKYALVIEFHNNEILIHFLNDNSLLKKEFKNVSFSPGYGIKLSKKCVF